MSPTPTESRIFATRYEREARRLERLHAEKISPGTIKWVDAMQAVYDRMIRAGSPIKQAVILSRVIDYVSNIKKEEKISFRLGDYSTKRTAALSLATIEFDRHPLTGPNEDGVCLLKFSIVVPRNGSTHFSTDALAYISRHAIERMHERRNRPLTKERATEMFTAIAALGLMASYRPEHDAMCLPLDDVLAVGQMRCVAGPENRNGRRVYGMLYEVRTMLPIDELDPSDGRLKQGRIALTAVTDWAMNNRKDPEGYASKIPILAARDETYTTKTAVKATA
jgi:hypothetical protein